MLLIVAGGNAERNKAAAEPAAYEAENEAKYPAKGALFLIHMSHASVSAVLALHSDGMIWPVARRVGSTLMSAGNHDDLGTDRLSDHHGLSRSLSHYWLSLGSVLGLAHRLGGVHRLLTDQWLLLGHGLACGDAMINILLVHCPQLNTIIKIRNIYLDHE